MTVTDTHTHLYSDAFDDDRKAMIEAGMTYPGLNQVLAGCVTPYGDLAYSDAEDLLAGLASFRAELVRPLRFEVGSSSTLGSYIFRNNNQDSCGHVILDSQCGSRKLRAGFFCVADGIGGIEDGEHASRLAVETATTAFVRGWSFYGAERLEKAAVSFARGVARVASQRLALEGEFARENNRGGTTFTGLLIAGGRAGDFRRVHDTFHVHRPVTRFVVQALRSGCARRCPRPPSAVRRLRPASCPAWAAVFSFL